MAKRATFQVMDYMTPDKTWRVAIDYLENIKRYQTRVIFLPGTADRLESVFHRDTLRDALSAVVVTMEYYQQNRGR